MIYPEPARAAKLYYVLAEIDADLERQTRAAGCPHCQGPLHSARYERKPRGGPPSTDRLGGSGNAAPSRVSANLMW